MGYQQQNYAPKDFEVLCDDKVVKKIPDAQYTDNLLTIALPPTTCTTVELRITGYYGKSPAIRELEIYGKSPETPKKDPPAKQTGFRWEQSETALALLKDGHVLWRLNFDRKEGKPYFHPVALPDGTVLTWLRPPDHPWHRALWWSWKLIDGLNYWEEDRKTGLSAGRTEIVDVKVTPVQDWSARIEMELSYHPTGRRESAAPLPDASPVLRERRLIAVSALDAASCYRMDWTTTFTAGERDVNLDRTPIPGQPKGVGHGGYAGLSARMAEATRKWVFTNSEGQIGSAAHGKAARWMDFSGKTAAGGEGGLCIFDHPKNLRHPSPWYVAQGMPYVSPALLFNEPYTLPAGSSLTLRYRILVHTGVAGKEALDKEWGDFSKS